MAYKRNYRKEYVTHGDGKEVDHKNMNPLDNRAKNIRIVPKAVNRRKQPKRRLK
jgi:hypothetical protein